MGIIFSFLNWTLLLTDCQVGTTTSLTILFHSSLALCYYTPESWLLLSPLKHVDFSFQTPLLVFFFCTIFNVHNIISMLKAVSCLLGYIPKEMNVLPIRCISFNLFWSALLFIWWLLEFPAEKTSIPVGSSYLQVQVFIRSSSRTRSLTWLISGVCLLVWLIPDYTFC